MPSSNYNIAADHCLSSAGVGKRLFHLPATPAHGIATDHCLSSAGVAADSLDAISFSTVAHLNSANQQHLASAACASVMFVQCTEHQPSDGQGREASLLDLNHLTSLGCCAYSSIRGLVEHTRLQACLRCAAF